MFNQVIAGMGRAAEGACLLKHSLECTEKGGCSLPWAWVLCTNISDYYDVQI